ncbi:TetR/AcrR family transcriptional regulator [Streptomyces sp. NPDC048179]|uniref:TetR/AcrR family transcriptional regulator n=1 Tax=Streptomyces sp. NPDC048179 TaxID=3365506 RepID=UPI0037162DDC
MPLDDSLVRAPKQLRSQQAFDRVLDVTLRLLAEQGYENFTVAEVSKQSRVSIGSIYCRVTGKDDLLRAAQQRFLERMRVEEGHLTDPRRWGSTPLAELIPSFVGELSDLLRRNAPLLAAFHTRAAVDEVVSDAGTAAYVALHDGAVSVILGRGEEILHEDPRRAASASFDAAYSVLARRLAVHVPQEAASSAPLDTVVEDVGRMALAFLLSRSG